MRQNTLIVHFDQSTGVRSLRVGLSHHLYPSPVYATLWQAFALSLFGYLPEPNIHEGPDFEIYLLGEKFFQLPAVQRRFRDL